MGPNVGVIHFFEPVGRGAEWALNTKNKISEPITAVSYLIVNHREAKVGVIKVEIKGDTPHHNQSDGELNNLKQGNNNTQCQCRKTLLIMRILLFV